jgi:thiamine-phosphate pyrophosphorylase
VTRTASRDSPIPSLNAIVDVEVAARAGWDAVDLAAAFLRGGARFLQIRAKEASGGEFLAISTRVVELAHGHDALVIVNDRADIARLSGADGVHVGQDDLAPHDVRRVVGDRAIVGLSTHTVDQLIEAVRQPVTYVAIGPVFGSVTKATGYDAVGLDTVRAAAVCAWQASLPLVAIGGITLDTGASVLQAGAASVAVIGDLLATGDPEARVQAFLERLDNRGG